MTPFALFADSGILVTGNARSGTTLLISLLDSHPQILCIPVETKFSTALNQADPAAYLTEERCLAQTRLNVHRGVTHGFEYDRLATAFREFLADRTDEKTLFLALVYAFHLESARLGRDSGRLRFWAEKTPAHFKSYALFRESFGRLKNVHMVRNPYDLFASWKDRQPGNTLDLLIKEAGLSLKHSQSQDQDVLVLRYEDLVSNPEACVARMTGFLGLEDDPGLLRPTHLGQSYGGNSSHGIGHSAISSAGLYRYAQRMEEADFHTIRRELADYLEYFGYDHLQWSTS